MSQEPLAKNSKDYSHQTNESSKRNPQHSRSLGLFLVFLGLILLVFLVNRQGYLTTLIKYVMQANHKIINPPKHKNPAAYPTALLTVQHQKKELQYQFKHKQITLEQVSQRFTSLIQHEIWAYWYGTDWSFSGTSKQPQQGSIACGYFVTTTLEHMGVTLNRVKLSQMPSETMILQLIKPQSVQRFSGYSFEDFLNKMQQQANGIYVIGLDFHTGFILKDDTGSYMVHSGGGFPAQVIKEKLSESIVVEQSKYRVIGSLTHDKDFLLKWLNVT